MDLHDVEVAVPSDLEVAIRKTKERGIEALYIWRSWPRSCSRNRSPILLRRTKCRHSIRSGKERYGGLLPMPLI